VIYDSVANDKNRLAVIKNFTMFQSDLKNNKLPQYMFFTPNMTNDGHDTNVTFAGKWASDFLTPLLTNKNFMQNTLVLLTFDEDETYTERNSVFALLLGDAVPAHLAGTSDNTYYNHYSEIATLEFNWDLHTLGRWDVGANVFDFVTDKCGDECDRPREWSGQPPFSAMFFNSSYAGPLNNLKNHTPWAAPDVDLRKCGRTVLPKIVETWKNAQKDTYYTGRVEIPDGMHPPVYG
jgi:acid phosphatase